MKHRRWWVGLGLILLVAAGFRFVNYRFALPYYADSDEPWFFYEAAFQRGLVPLWIAPNPSPALIDIYKLAQMSSEALTQQSALAHVPDIFTAMRFISVILSLLTIVFIGLCARELVDDKAGWMAAATWALIPLVIHHSFIAIAEPWMMLLAAISLYAGARALKQDGLRWPLLSVWAGLLGFTFKYSMFPFAGLGLAVVLWKLWVQPEQRRQRIRTAAILVVSIVGFLIFMVLFGGLVGDVNGRQREVALFFNNPISRYRDLGNVANLVAVAFWQFGMAPVIFFGLYVAGLFVVIRERASRTNPRLAAWVLLGALGSFTALLVPAYLFIAGTLGRYLFSATMIFAILAACSLAVIYDYVRARMTMRRWNTGLALVSLILVIIWLAPLTVADARQEQEDSKPYTLTDMMVWASNTLSDGGMVAESEGDRAFDREWGGYQGPKRLLTFDVDVMKKSPQEWQSEGYRYVELVQDQVEQFQKTPDGQAYLNQMQELRRFPAPESTEAWGGLSYVVYQVNRPQTNTDIVFGNTFHLVGYDGLQTSSVPGTTLHLTFYWQALHMPDNNYSLFLHLEPEQTDQLLAQADGAPGPALRPTLTWAVPSETLVSEPFALTLPEGLAAGQYRLFLGVYNPYSGQRLATAQGDQVLLTTLNVTKGS